MQRHRRQHNALTYQLELGVIRLRDHHLREAPLLTMVTGNGLFRPAGGNRPTLQFDKTAAREATP